MAEIKRKWVNVRGISAHTGLSEDWFNRDRVTALVGVPYVRVSRRILYDVDAVDEFLSALTVRPSEARDVGHK